MPPLASKIKVSLGKLAVPYSLESDLPGILEDSGFAMLSLSFHHLGGVARLPLHHRDPFDPVQIHPHTFCQLFDA